MFSTLTLAVLVAAQGKNDRAWLDLNRVRTLWMASGNAAGLAVQAPQSFNLVEARYDREDGSWRPLQSGEHTANVQFDTQGARQIGAVRLWGHFRYNNVNEKESSFNTLLYNPYDERFLYTAADSVEGQWKKQSYEMEFKAAVPLGERLATGLHVHYADRIAAGQIDPRAESYHYAVTVKPGLVWKTGASRIGLNGLYAHTLERSTPSISNSQQIQKVYLMRGLGNFVGEQVGGGWCSTDPLNAYEEDDNYILQMGSGDSYIFGDHEFRYGYDIIFRDDRDESGDFMYIDVLPTNWQTPIESADINIEMPKAIEKDWVTVYIGQYGSEADDTMASWELNSGGKNIRIHEEDLDKGVGITVLARLPEGYWVGVEDDQGTKTAATGLPALLALILGGLWARFGRRQQIVQTVGGNAGFPLEKVPFSGFENFGNNTMCSIPATLLQEKGEALRNGGAVHTLACGFGYSL